MAEITVARATRKNQVVERNLVTFAEDGLLLEIDAIDMTETDFDIRRVSELHADGHRDVRRIEPGCGHLIEQRLE